MSLRAWSEKRERPTSLPASLLMNLATSPIGTDTKRSCRMPASLFYLECYSVTSSVAAQW